MDDKEIKEARFGLDDWVGNRVSKYDDHAFDEVMTPRWFDGYNGYLDEEIEKLLPPLPKIIDEEKQGVVTEAFALGWAACKKEAQRIIKEESKETLKEMQDDINRKLKEDKSKEEK